MPHLLTFPSKFKKASRKIDSYAYDEDIEKSMRNAKLLGTGGFASVYKVTRDGQKEALKVIHVRKYVESAHIPIIEVLERLDRLCTMLRDNPHANLIRYLGWSCPRDDLYIRLELCSPRDLFARVTESPLGHLTEEESRDVAKGLCSAVLFLHSQEWVHRDIKPENILFATDDSPYDECLLSDLGCALDKIGAEEWYTGCAGSAGYLSPEMAHGEPWSHVTDEFSIGVTLYECLSGRSPIVSNDPKIAYARPAPFPAKYWAEYSSEAKDFVKSLLEYDPDKRMRAEEALYHPWLRNFERRPSAQSTDSSSSDLSWTEQNVTRPAMPKEKLSTYFSRISQHAKVIEDLDNLRLSPLGSLSSEASTDASNA